MNPESEPDVEIEGPSSISEYSRGTASLDLAIETVLEELHSTSDENILRYLELDEYSEPAVEEARNLIDSYLKTLTNFSKEGRIPTSFFDENQDIERLIESDPQFNLFVQEFELQWLKEANERSQGLCYPQFLVTACLLIKVQNCLDYGSGCHSLLADIIRCIRAFCFPSPI